METPTNENLDFIKVWLLYFINALNNGFTESNLQKALLLMSIIYTAIKAFKELRQKGAKNHG